MLNTAIKSRIIEIFICYNQHGDHRNINLALFVRRLGKEKIESVMKPTPNKNERFYELPKPTGKAPYHLALGSVIPEQVDSIENSGEISFHILGDTGGTKTLEAGHVVEAAMESDFDHHNLSFLYHLGDVIYKFGEASEYYCQFYEPYAHYPGPVFAIPGNKDGDVRPDSNEKSLAAFVNNFCAKKQEITVDAGDIDRDAMMQPNVYWTLSAPFVTIIGLYSNVPDGGVIKQDQFDWFKQELMSAPKDKALILTVHHAPFSADDEHSGSSMILNRLDEAFKQARRIPDIVFSGHVHNYQRFTRELDNGGKKYQVPYVVVGTGGHWKLHHMQKNRNGDQIDIPYKLPDRDDVVLENYCDNRYGFMRVHVTVDKLEGKFYSVASPHKLWDKDFKKIDEIKLHLQKHSLA
jgi:acid phosphatase type 7